MVSVFKPRDMTGFNCSFNNRDDLEIWNTKSCRLQMISSLFGTDDSWAKVTYFPAGTPGLLLTEETIGMMDWRDAAAFTFRAYNPQSWSIGLKVKVKENLYKLRDSHTFDRVYRYYVNVSALILDDLAYMPFAPEKVDYLFRLIFDRSEKKTGPVIVTTNTDVKEWWSFFPSKAMGMTFSDRVLGGAVGLRFTGKSIRRAPRKQKDKK